MTGAEWADVLKTTIPSVTAIIAITTMSIMAMVRRPKNDNANRLDKP
jgi:hypothetical protein